MPLATSRPLPPKYVLYTRAPAELNLETNASDQPLSVDWYEFSSGKLEEDVVPVTYAAPWASSAMPFAVSGCADRAAAAAQIGAEQQRGAAGRDARHECVLPAGQGALIRVRHGEIRVTRWNPRYRPCRSHPPRCRRHDRSANHPGRSRKPARCRTNSASPQRHSATPRLLRWKAPLVAGKLVEVVSPAT